jgi:hypothetical protein
MEKRKKLLVFVSILLISISLIAQRTNSNHVHVNGYTRSNGTYVAPHYKTAPNSTNRDNFSTSGNTNPYTGQAGWITPDNKPLTVPETNTTSSSSDDSYEKLKRELDRINGVDSRKKEDYRYSTSNTTTSSFDDSYEKLKRELDRINGVDSRKKEDYRYSTSNTTTSSFDDSYEKLKREMDRIINAEGYESAKREVDRINAEGYKSLKREMDRINGVDGKKREDYWYNMANSNPFSKNENITIVNESVRGAINYHNRYSLQDKIILEKMLDKLGYTVGSIDGDIDENTIDAIQEFQRDNKLSSDGKAGDITVKKMIVKLRE